MLQRTGLRKEMSGARHDFHALDALQLGERVHVELQHLRILGADDQQRRRAHGGERRLREIRSSAARYDRTNDLRTLCRGDERRRRSSARAEEADAKHALAETLGDEVDDRHQAVGEQLHVEAKLTGPLVLFLFHRRQQVEEQGGEPSVLQLARDLPVSRTQAAASAAVGEQYDARGPVRHRKVTIDCASGHWKPDMTRSNEGLRYMCHGTPHSADGNVSGVSPRTHAAVRSSGSTARVMS